MREVLLLHLLHLSVILYESNTWGVTEFLFKKLGYNDLFYINVYFIFVNRNQLKIYDTPKT